MLTNFKLVNTDGLKGLHFKGDNIPFDQIDDQLAEQLMGKTHVLARLNEAPSTQPLLTTGDAEGVKKNAE
ncbi:MAG: hypothetical protein ACRYFK_16725 [Janthinobacterium lividum]